MQTETPLVGVVMGSDSDWPVMSAAAEALDEFGVTYEADVVSAHRMPRDMISYGEQAAERGLKVIIAGAGGAAHLPGMLASVTPLPVIGVPVPLKYLDGLDSLLSIVQMPAGIPVATVAVGGARNAGCSRCASWRRRTRRCAPRSLTSRPGSPNRPVRKAPPSAPRSDAASALGTGGTTTFTLSCQGDTPPTPVPYRFGHAAAHGCLRLRR